MRVLLTSLLALAGCAAPALPPVEIHPLELRDNEGEAFPFLAPGAAGVVHMTSIASGEEGARLRLRAWDGERWSAARTIATGADWLVNWADFPAVAAADDPLLAVHWLVRDGRAPHAYGVRVALSRDGGHVWGDPLVPHDDGTATEHGFVSFVAAPGGGFDLVWLDGRETSPGGAHAGTGGGAMTLRSATLGPDGALRDPRVVDRRVCDCCQTDAVRAGDGALVVAYRDRSEDEVRDIAVARLEAAGWGVPTTVHADRWRIEGCPVNGPAIASDGTWLAVAWFTLAGGAPAVRVAFSENGARSFGTPVSVDGGSPLGRVDLALVRGVALVSWIEDAELRVRRVHPSGATEPWTVVAPIDASRGSGFPRLAVAGDDALVAWTETGDPPRIRVSRVGGAFSPAS